MIYLSRCRFVATRYIESNLRAFVNIDQDKDILIGEATMTHLKQDALEDSILAARFLRDAKRMYAIMRGNDHARPWHYANSRHSTNLVDLSLPTHGIV